MRTSDVLGRYIKISCVWHIEEKERHNYLYPRPLFDGPEECFSFISGLYALRVEGTGRGGHSTWAVGMKSSGAQLTPVLRRSIFLFFSVS